MIELAFIAVLATQTPPVPIQDPPATQLEEVVVEGQRLRDAVETFVDDIVAPPIRRGPARWHEKVCVGVANLQREAAQVLADEVSSVALSAGLEPGEPGCRPNILVIATDDGPEMAKTLVNMSPRAFRPNYSGAARSSEALDRFQASEAPVRWWHVSLPVSRDTGRAAVRLPGHSAPMIRQDGSRLTTRIRNDLLRALIIVDVSRMEAVTFQQLGDYVGMVALAQIDPDAQTAAYDTVLNLFDDPASVKGATDWDHAYLTALYEAELTGRAASHQGGEIAALMLRDTRTSALAETD